LFSSTAHNSTTNNNNNNKSGGGTMKSTTSYQDHMLAMSPPTTEVAVQVASYDHLPTKGRNQFGEYQGAATATETASYASAWDVDL
jgi:hypothetical protein